MSHARESTAERNIGHQAARRFSQNPTVANSRPHLSPEIYGSDYPPPALERFRFIHLVMETWPRIPITGEYFGDSYTMGNMVASPKALAAALKRRHTEAHYVCSWPDCNARLTAKHLLECQCSQLLFPLLRH